MNDTLNLADHLLALGNHYHDVGRPQDAHEVLTQLIDFRTLSPQIAGQALLVLAEIQLKRRRYKKARRHLTAVLACDNDSATTHYLMAVACREDNLPRRAVRHFARAIELDPTDVKCRGEYGQHLIQVGRTDDGIEHLLRAREDAPNDLDALGRLVAGLRQAGKLDEARDILRKSRFDFPRSAAFDKMARDFQFQILRQQQEFDRLQAEAMTNGDKPMLLPFTRHEAHESLPRPKKHRFIHKMDDKIDDPAS